MIYLLGLIIGASFSLIIFFGIRHITNMDIEIAANKAITKQALKEQVILLRAYRDHLLTFMWVENGELRVIEEIANGDFGYREYTEDDQIIDLNNLIAEDNAREVEENEDYKA